jgi:hypothetical protein
VQKGNVVEPKKKYYCSFCGKGEAEVMSIVTSEAANICDECIVVCGQAIKDNHIRQINSIRLCINPREWTKEMSDAWHKALPDTEKAFADLYSTALANLQPSVQNVPTNDHE